MPTIFIHMKLKLKCFVAGLLFLCLSIATLSIDVFFFWFTEKITLWFWIIKLSHAYFLLLQLVRLANILMNLVDSFQLQIFRETTLNTANVPGISQFPSGTSLNLASSTFDWSHIGIFPAIMPVLQSQMLPQMMGISRSCCAVSLFSIQCTRWGVPFKSYSRLCAVNTQGLMQLTRLSPIVQVLRISYLQDINDWVKI